MNLLTIKNFLISIGIISEQINKTDMMILIAIIFVLALACDFICKKIALFALHIYSQVKHKSWDEDPLKKKVIEKFAALIPALIFNIFLPIFFEKGAEQFVWIGKICSIYILITAISFLFAVLDFLYNRYIQKMVLKSPSTSSYKSLN